MLTEAEILERRSGIGGSDIAAILGLDNFRGPLAVYLSKVEDMRPAPNSDMERGTFLEDGIAQWYASREGVRLCSPGSTAHAKTAIARCTPDRLAYLGATERIISIKAPRRAGDNWGETGGSMVPTGYVLQLQWEHMVLRSHKMARPGPIGIDDLMHLVALVEGDLRVYPVVADLDLQAQLLKFAEGWWAKHVAAKVPPPLDGSAEGTTWLKRRFPTVSGDMLTATLDDELLLMRYRALEAATEKAEQEQAVVKQLIQERIGSAPGITGSTGRVTWRADKNGKRSFKPQWTKGENA